MNNNANAARSNAAKRARNAFLSRFNKKSRRGGSGKRGGKRSTRRVYRRGGALGRIPPAATVSIQQDPYSARVLVDTETAEDIFDARDTYLM